MEKKMKDLDNIIDDKPVKLSDFFKLYNHNPKFKQFINGLIISFSGLIFLMAALISLHAVFIMVGYLYLFYAIALANIFFMKVKMKLAAGGLIVVGTIVIINSVYPFLGKFTNMFPYPWDHIYDLIWGAGILLIGISLFSTDKNGIYSINLIAGRKPNIT